MPLLVEAHVEDLVGRSVRDVSQVVQQQVLSSQVSAGGRAHRLLVLPPPQVRQQVNLSADLTETERQRVSETRETTRHAAANGVETAGILKELGKAEQSLILESRNSMVPFSFIKKEGEYNYWSRI